ncbi:MAG TPA: hypothetical protein P5523_08395 [Bacteroidales bacterium]|nr:hypothetical protein [Bacteroidales bacterium]
MANPLDIVYSRMNADGNTVEFGLDEALPEPPATMTSGFRAIVFMNDD